MIVIKSFKSENRRGPDYSIGTAADDPNSVRPTLSRTFYRKDRRVLFGRVPTLPLIPD